MLRPFPIVLIAVLLSGCTAGSTESAPVPVTSAEAAPHAHGVGTEEISGLVGDGTTAYEAGYTLTDVSLPTAAGVPGVARFAITFGGTKVQSYLPEQTKDLHLYLVRTDYAVFRHLHPTRADDGTWSAPVTLPEPGDYRVITQFVAKDAGGDGDSLMLGARATVGGAWSPRPIDRPLVGDDGTVRASADGAGTVGEAGTVRLRVSDVLDRPVDLGTYLGAYAHVTAFHVDSGSVVHMHPEGTPEVRQDGAYVSFHTTFEKPGAYLCMVQVRVDGLIHTLPVALEVS